jgi:pimeloyl-ACP methyl ester carboxylesterase
MTGTDDGSRTGPIIEVSDAELADLRRRLNSTKWPQSWPASAAVPAWQAGTDLGELRRLVTYWAAGFDWRTQEAAINALPWRHYEKSSYDKSSYDKASATASFLRFDGEARDSFPIVITNGWPSTFLEMVELGRRLSRPSEYGGSAADAFTVIVPCLPGFAFSEQDPALPAQVSTHELWHEIMTSEFGGQRYGAHGGDLGAGITSRLAQAHPEAVAGIHLLSVAAPAEYDDASLTAAERAYLEQVNAWSADEGAYQHQQMTRPATLSVGLSDSPAGLLSWIVEKYRSWSDNDGVLARTFNDDLILTQASLYWFTNSIGTSFRPYYEYAHGMTDRVKAVSTPTAVAVFPKDLTHPPRSWAERSYHVVRYTEMAKGGHFAPHEQPDLLAADISAFFRTLR